MRYSDSNARLKAMLHRGEFDACMCDARLYSALQKNTPSKTPRGQTRGTSIILPNCTSSRVCVRDQVHMLIVHEVREQISYVKIIARILYTNIHIRGRHCKSNKVTGRKILNNSKAVSWSKDGRKIRNE